MMIKQKKQLAIAASVAATIGLGASTAQAVDFTASATVENTLTVTNVANFDTGTVFATATGAALNNGVGALVISPAGTVTDPTDSATVQLISLGTPVPAQGSVAMAASFDLTLPATNTIAAADFAADAGTSLVNITNGTGNAVELVHSSGNPVVPSLWLMHFTIGDVSGGTVGTETATFDGGFPVTQAFGETTYVFNIGGTVTTEPSSTGAQNYQSGVYSGTLTVTASY